MPLHRNKLILILSGLLVLSATKVTESQETNQKSANCCNGENKVVNRTCSDGEEWNNMCEKGRFLLDPAEDADDRFIVKQNGDLYQVQHDAIVEKGQFCVTSIEEEDNEGAFRDVAFICFIESVQESSELFLIRGLLSFVSVLFLCITLYIYWIVKDLRDTQDKVTIFALVCVTIFLFLLGVLQIFPNLFHSFLCKVFAFLILFFVLAHFSWLNMVMANVWKVTVMRHWKVKETTWYVLMHLYAWTIPIVIIAVCLVGHHTEYYKGPDFGKTSCWFGDPDLAWYYMYIPMTAMLTINILFFISTAITLCVIGADISPDRRRVLTYRCKLYVPLFFLAGLNWFFEILSHKYSFNSNYAWFWLIIDTINVLHGVIIFIILVVARKRVLRALAGKRVFCFKIPELYAPGEDLEEETLQNEGRSMKVHNPEYLDKEKQ